MPNLERSSPSMASWATWIACLRARARNEVGAQTLNQRARHTATEGTWQGYSQSARYPWRPGRGTRWRICGWSTTREANSPEVDPMKRAQRGLLQTCLRELRGVQGESAERCDRGRGWGGGASEEKGRERQNLGRPNSGETFSTSEDLPASHFFTKRGDRASTVGFTASLPAPPSSS